MKPEDELNGSYSPTELRIFKALRKRPSNAGVQFATSVDLLTDVYPRKNERPRYANVVLNHAISQLGDKLEENNEPFRLTRERRPPQRAMVISLVDAKRSILIKHRRAARKAHEEA